MFRLLQGDVGCGKTLVALLASVAVMEQGGQVALMVPTEILAEQHHRRALDLLEGTGHAVALLTSQSRSDSDGNLLPTIAGGEVGMVVGTHALIQEAVRFRRLGLVVVDEQHRFGVRQRELLRDKGTEPHQLFMTATPIPRSLALAFYGDLDVTRIDEMPPGRLPVRTLLRKPADRDKIYRFIRKEVGRGGKAAIIVPAISSDEVSSDGGVLGPRRGSASRPTLFGRAPAHDARIRPGRRTGRGGDYGSGSGSGRAGGLGGGSGECGSLRTLAASPASWKGRARRPILMVHSDRGREDNSSGNGTSEDSHASF